MVQIDRAMYGLIQSARLLYNTITGVLEKDGYSANKAYHPTRLSDSHSSRRSGTSEDSCFPPE